LGTQAQIDSPGPAEEQDGQVQEDARKSLLAAPALPLLLDNVERWEESKQVALSHRQPMRACDRWRQRLALPGWDIIRELQREPVKSIVNVHAPLPVSTNAPIYTDQKLPPYI
jgi:hypothetical protein